jgi:hypothetical protein
MGDEKINRFCKLVVEINTLNEDLRTMKPSLIPEAYSDSVHDLRRKQVELKRIISTINDDSIVPFPNELAK